MSKKSVFAERDRNLKLIGFGSYEDYLASELWSWVRSQLLGSVSDKCECCRTTSGLCLHHRDYSLAVLCGNFSNVHGKIVRVCSECHLAIHSEGDEWFDLLLVDERFQLLAGRAPLTYKGKFHRDGLPKTWKEAQQFESVFTKPNNATVG